MANIASTDVTYTITVKDKTQRGHKKNIVTLAFGDGALTYPAGGIPLLGANMGCPVTIESLVVFDKGTSGYHFTFDRTNTKLVVMQTASHTHDLLLKNAAVADGASARVNAGANLLGANTGADLTVTGSGANGGIVAKAGFAAAEASTVAIAAQTIQVEVVGW